MTYSGEIPPHTNRARCPQQTVLACVGAATADAMGDVAGWDVAERQTVQTAIINDLGLHWQGATLHDMRAAGTKRFGRDWVFEARTMDFGGAVRQTMGAGVVLILAPVQNRIGHAYHLIAGSFPLQDRELDDLPPILKAQMRKQDDLLEHLWLWDPWDNLCKRMGYGEAREAFERAGSGVLLMARNQRRQ